MANLLEYYIKQVSCGELDFVKQETLIGNINRQLQFRARRRSSNSTGSSTNRPVLVTLTEFVSPKLALQPC